MMDGWMITPLSALVALAAMCVVITIIPAILVKAAIKHALKTQCKGRLVLSYDDGPGRRLTPPLVELLRKYQAKASFFLVGFRATDSPAMCQLLRENGHELGCHTQMHRPPWQVLPWTAVRDLNDGYQEMSEWMPANALFRPPFGKLTTWTWIAAKRRGAPLSFWTRDGCDTHKVLPDPSCVAHEIVNTGGAVVLLHSHDRGDDRQEYVLRLTEELLKGAKQHNLKICTMSELGGSHAQHT